MASTNTSAAEGERYELFGGAVTAQLPKGLVDASNLRQIPDNQEVLLFPQSDVTCIVEVLEAVEPTDPEEAIRFHFASLAHDNEASTSEVLSVSSPTQPPSTAGEAGRQPVPTRLTGLQTVRKFNKDDSPLDTVRIHLAVWRLAPAKNVDLVMSWNEPTQPPAAGGDAAQLGSEQIGSPSVAQGFAAAVDTLRIEDWGLFA